MRECFSKLPAAEMRVPLPDEEPPPLRAGRTFSRTGSFAGASHLTCPLAHSISHTLPLARPITGWHLTICQPHLISCPFASRVASAVTGTEPHAEPGAIA